MSRRELLLLRREDAFGLANGQIPELPATFDLQDSIAPICLAARALAPDARLTARLFAGEVVLNLFACQDAPGLDAWVPAARLHEQLDPLSPDAAQVATASGGPPWYRDAFHDQLLGFASARLAEIGVESLGAPEQVRISPLSCVYRLPCADENFWLKAARPGAFVPEAEIMLTLHGSFPDRVPPPLAFDADCVLFPDFGERLEEHEDPDLIERMLASFADLQARGDALLATPGLQSWRLADLPRDLAGAGEWLGSDAEALLRRIERDSEELGALGIGDRLVHGDFYWGNVARAGDRLHFFDWADAGISHPFFDPMVVLFASEPARAERLTRAYLDVWREHTRADVTAAWHIARRLAPAHHLARNLRLLSHLEPFERETVAGGARFFADRLKNGYAES
jgi:hypothetical protein